MTLHCMHAAIAAQLNGNKSFADCLCIADLALVLSVTCAMLLQHNLTSLLATIWLRQCI